MESQIQDGFPILKFKYLHHHLLARPNGYPESKMAKSKMAESKMATKAKMAPPFSNPNISPSFQPIWIKICMHHLLDQNLRAPPLGQA